MSDLKLRPTVAEAARRHEVAQVVSSLIHLRFPWLRSDAIASAAVKSHLMMAVSNCNDSALTMDATMSAMLDAMHSAVRSV